jgi:hypothetical protein
MKRICIVGGGAAALLLLLQFEKHNIDPKWITVIDPTHTGGDLSKKWLHVKSNTIWRQILEAVPSQKSSIEPWSTLNPEEPCELKHVIHYLRECSKSYMNQTVLRTDAVLHAEQEESVWKLSLQHTKQPLLFDLVFFCQGSEPKTLDLPYPSIPLDVALDRQRLSDHVKPGQHILLFGTAHSGTLIVKNLSEVGVKVTNFYANKKPFQYDRDGDYDGLKQEAAAIADGILRGEYPNVSLESVCDTSAVIRASRTADACIYACGFEPRTIHPNLLKYTGETGQIEGTTNAWGFGIAYPNRAPDGIHWDVSVPSFQAHIQKQMPAILTALQA